MAGEAGAYLGSRVLVAEEGEGVAGGNGQPDGGGDDEDDVVGLAQLGAALRGEVAAGGTSSC